MKKFVKFFTIALACMLCAGIVVGCAKHTHTDGIDRWHECTECGEMHEYYDPETGAGVNNRGFQSWNLLVRNLCDELERE